MNSRFSTGFALGALLGSTALLVPLAALAEPAPAAPPAQSAAPAPTTPPHSDAVHDKDKQGKETQAKDTQGKDTTENKALVAYKAFFDARVAGLHAGLQLTPAQAPLWAPVETAIRDLAKTHYAIHHAPDDDGQPRDPLRQLQRTSDRLIKGGQAMKALADATEPLLAALDEDQKDRISRLIEGMQPDRILREAFNVRDDRHAASDEDHGGDEGHHRGPRMGDRDGPRDHADSDDGYERHHRQGQEWDREGGRDREDDHAERRHHRDYGSNDDADSDRGEDRRHDADRSDRYRGGPDENARRPREDRDERT